jgi:hypothetical protein
MTSTDMESRVLTWAASVAAVGVLPLVMFMVARGLPAAVHFRPFDLTTLSSSWRRSWSCRCCIRVRVARSRLPVEGLDRPDRQRRGGRGRSHLPSDQGARPRSGSFGGHHPGA